MKVHLSMMGGLKQFQPPDKSVDLPDATSVEQVLESLGIASDQVQVVLRNGKPQADRSQPCEDGDTLIILPLVGGG